MENHIAKAFRSAFPRTIPILTGYLFLGMAFGILMQVSGFPIWLVVIMSIVIYSGSMQFIAVSILLAPFDPIQAFLMTLMVNARHIFYGISMLEKYRDIGLKKLYMIFAMTDETFSINCSFYIPRDVDKGWFMFFVSLLDHIYWIMGGAFGAAFGSVIKFNTAGLDFVMTAMFVVIVLEQFLGEKKHDVMLMGFVISIICRLIFGAAGFIIPCMIAIIAALAFMRKNLEASEAKQ